MYCEAEPAFEGADVVFKEVRIFIEVYGFQCELSESLSSVCIGR